MLPFASWRNSDVVYTDSFSEYHRLDRSTLGSQLVVSHRVIEFLTDWAMLHELLHCSKWYAMPWKRVV